MLLSRRAVATLVTLVALLQGGAWARQQGQGAPQDEQQQPQGQQPAEQGQADQQPEPPTFRESINFVRVDVIVTDDDRPVTDLSERDFEVLEDGKPQEIQQFRLVRIDGNVAPGTSPPRQIRTRNDEEEAAAQDDTRLFLFFLDDYHVRRGTAMSVRSALTRFVQTELRPTDMVAVMTPLTPVDAISFTRNVDSVVSAIESFEGRKFIYEPRNQFEAQYARYPTEVVEQIRNDVVMTALRGAAVRLGALREGRKTIVYVSEGLTAMLPPQLRNADASMPAIPCVGGLQTVNCNPAAGNPMMGDNDPREQTARAFAQADLYSRMRDVYDAANRNNTAIYTLDPRGVAAGEFDIDENVGPRQDREALRMTQDTLRILAEETDGRAIVNRNDLVEGLAQMVRDASVYYLIGYTSSSAPSDGKFHEIQVRVKRPGVEVRARKGYWAVTAADVVKASTPVAEPARPIQEALAAIAPAVQANRYVRTWIGTARGDAGKTRVTLVWEPLEAAPGQRRETPGRVSLLAATEQGDLVFRGRSPEAALASAAPAAAPGASAAAAPQRLVFDAAPGELELRMSVEAAGGGGVLDQEIKTITVPDFTSPDAVLSTPRVYRARTARELNEIRANAAAVPVAGREFSRTERLLIRFDVYGAAQPTAALLNRNGDKMADLPVQPATAGGTHRVEFGLNSVPPGEYLVQIAAPSATGESRQLVPLRVVS